MSPDTSIKEWLRSRRSFLADARQTYLELAFSRLLSFLITKLLGQSGKIKGKEQLIVRSLQPDNLETPIELLRSWVPPLKENTISVGHFSRKQR